MCVNWILSQNRTIDHCPCDLPNGPLRLVGLFFSDYRQRLDFGTCDCASIAGYLQLVCAAAFDLDADSDVDLGDFARLANQFQGSK